MIMKGRFKEKAFISWRSGLSFVWENAWKGEALIRLCLLRLCGWLCVLVFGAAVCWQVSACGVRVECRQDQDCTAPKNVCALGICKQCTTDTDCPPVQDTGALRRCDLNSFLCIDATGYEPPPIENDPPCLPGNYRSCYTGPPKTLGLGTCKAGRQTCQPDGSWGPCEGQTLPQEEDLCSGQDRDCNGVPNDGPQSLCQKQEGVCFGSLKGCQDQTPVACGEAQYKSHSSQYADKEIPCDGLDNNCDGLFDQTTSRCVKTLTGDDKGATNGIGVKATFNEPTHLTRVGNLLYITDTGNHQIRTLDTTTLEVRLFLGTGSAGDAPGGIDSATFNRPHGLAHDPKNSLLFVADTANHRIRKIDLQAKQVSGFVGRPGQNPGKEDGNFETASFTSPKGLLMAPDGASFYVADTGNHLIRKVTLTGEVSTVAGSCPGTPCEPGYSEGEATKARFNSPTSMAWLDTSGTQMLITDTNNHCIRLLDLSQKQVSTYAGRCGVAGDKDGTKRVQARLNQPWGLLKLPEEAGFYISTHGLSAIRKLDSTSISTLAGGLDGFLDPPYPGVQSARFNKPSGLLLLNPPSSIYPSGQFLIADTMNHKIRALYP